MRPTAVPAIVVTIAFAGLAIAGPQDAPQPQPPAAASSSSESQTEPQSSQKAPKKKRVYTNFDLTLLRDKGGISVIGNSTPATESEKAPIKPAENTGKPAVAKLPEAPQADCLTYSWAAELESVVGLQGLPLDRTYWLLKSFGSDMCKSDLGNLQTLVGRIVGDYVLDDGSKVHLAVDATYAGQLNLPALVNAAQQGRASWIVVYRGHPYLVERIEGGEWIYDNGVRVPQLSKITLFDPYLNQSVDYTNKNNPSEINAALEITVQHR